MTKQATPKRIRCASARRAGGCRNTVYVGRPTKWGNPFNGSRLDQKPSSSPGGGDDIRSGFRTAVRLFERHVLPGLSRPRAAHLVSAKMRRMVQCGRSNYPRGRTGKWGTMTETKKPPPQRSAVTSSR